MSKNLDSPQKRSISPINRRESKISDQVVIDSSKLQERAMKAFTKLESILQSHQQRVASEKIRQRELEDIEKRADSLEEELKELFSHCRDGWQKEILYRYQKCISENNARRERGIAARMKRDECKRSY